MSGVTQQDLAAMIQAAVEGALAAQRAMGGSGPSAPTASTSGHRLDERHFRRMTLFKGDGWREWAFHLRTQLGAVSKSTQVLLDAIQAAGRNPDWDQLFLEYVDGEVDRMGAELYNLLVSLTSGEALLIVRGVGGNNGWEAWSKLAARYDPRTPALALRAMMACMKPRRVKDVREIQGAIEEWEGAVRRLNAEHRIPLDDSMRVALLTSMLPPDFQDCVFQWTDQDQGYETLKDNIVALAMNRTSLTRVRPMEVDRIAAATEGGSSAVDESEEDEGELCVDYVGEACHRCGGWGHYARECATQAGKGKGKQGGKHGKGKDGKPSHSGKGPGTKGNFFSNVGTGSTLSSVGPSASRVQAAFMGVCWTCGRKGHRSSDCTSGSAAIRAVEEGEVEEQTIGGVWTISQVNAGAKKVQLEGEVTIDSAAEESVCPKDWAQMFPTQTPRSWLKFANASGGRMAHYGTKRVLLDNGGEVLAMTFEASDVRKPLAAVWRIAEKGNRVQFGPSEGDNFIENVSTGKRIAMVRKGGSYVVPASFVADSSFQGQASWL